jgi:ferredoxin
MQLSGHEQQSTGVRGQSHICALAPVDRGAILFGAAYWAGNRPVAALQHERGLPAWADCTSCGQCGRRCTNLALLLSREPNKINPLYCNAIGTPVAYSPQ